MSNKAYAVLPKVLLFAFFLTAIASVQYSFDIKKASRPSIAPSVIPSQIIKVADLGLHSAASSLMWIYTIQQLLDHPEKSFVLIDTVNQLDPKFSYPYAFSALVLPAIGYEQDGITLAKRGIANADPDWRIPYYLATSYHIFLKDRENAALYFDIAARTPGAPEKIKILASRYGTSTNGLEQTKEIWQSIYSTTDDELIKQSALDHIVHIQILELLQQAVLAYKKAYGDNPQTLNDLVEKKILKEIPVSPLGIDFQIVDGTVVTRY